MKTIISALAALGALASAGAANAATTSSPVTAKFSVIGGTACTLQGYVADMGRFQTTDTPTTYAAKNGDFYITTVGAYTPGTAGSVPLVSVTCPVTTAYTVSIKGSGPSSLIQVLNPSNSAVFNAAPIVRTVAGNTVTAAAMNGSYSGSGTGSSQVYAGTYALDATTTTAQRTVNFVAGTYTGTATATLTW